MNDYFKDWNYRKHTKLCVGVYAALFALDMTIGYLVAKRLFASQEKEDRA